MRLAMFLVKNSVPFCQKLHFCEFTNSTFCRAKYCYLKMKEKQSVRLKSFKPVSVKQLITVY